MAIKDDAFFLAVGAVVIVGGAWYAKKKAGDLAATVAQDIADAIQAAKDALANSYNNVKQSVAAAADAVYTDARVETWKGAQHGALNVNGTIQSLQDTTGMNEDQARTIELLALGGMGA